MKTIFWKIIEILFKPTFWLHFSLNFQHQLHLTTRDGNLGDWRGVQRPLYTLHALIEDSGDAVRFDEYGAVADAKAESDADPQAGTRKNIRRGEDDEGHAVAAQDARQQHIAQLPARRFDNGRFVVPIAEEKVLSCGESGV